MKIYLDETDAPNPADREAAAVRFVSVQYLPIGWRQIVREGAAFSSASTVRAGMPSI